MKRMLMLGFAAAAVGVLAMPAESYAQRGFGRGFGAGFGRGYGGRSGLSIGFGNYGYGGYGRGLGYGYGGFGNGFYGSGYGYNRGYYGGRGYYGSGYYGGSNYYAPSYIYSSPSVIYADPSASDYAYYPPDASSGIVQASASYGASGNIVVYVPANAQVWWGNSPTSTTGVERRFATSTIGPEGEVNTFHAQWMDANGQMHNEARQVRAMPGQTVTLDFRQPIQNAQPQQAVTPNVNVVPNVQPNRNVNPTVPNRNQPNRNVHPDEAPPEPIR